MLAAEPNEIGHIELGALLISVVQTLEILDVSIFVEVEEHALSVCVNGEGVSGGLLVHQYRRNN